MVNVNEEKLVEYLKRVSADLHDTRLRLRAAEERHQEPIAVVSIACRFPGGVNTPEDLWRLVADGVDAIGDFPTNRGWDLDNLYHPDPDHPGTTYVRRGGFLYDADRFDPQFFGISPREALATSPQQRLLLETAWEACERAGIDPVSLKGSRTGVYAGTATTGGTTSGDLPQKGSEGYAGNAPSLLSGRVSYTLGLEGPAVTVETACSSSLVAIHLAGQALRQGECTLALAGGVTVMATPEVFTGFSRQRGLSPDGRCKAFSASADGTGWGEGVGLMLLERLSDARRNGHRVLAVIRGSAINQDGASNGFAAPNGPSQQRVIRQALASARLAPSEVDAVEAHGTGTKLGDPIEADALIATYGRDRPQDRPLWLGSLKSNIGHTQGAAGVAGVIKMVMALRHGVLPATLHAEELTPHVEWDGGGVRPLTEAVEWPDGERPRRAGVSSFGISGTNAHVIVEQAPEGDVESVSSEVGGVVPWVVSGRSVEALRGQAAGLVERVGGGSGLSVVDVGWSLVSTRSVFEYRAVVVGEGRGELVAGLEALAGGVSHVGVVQSGTAVVVGGVGPVLVFPGQGSQWVGMGAGLLEVSSVFAARVGECERALAPFVDWSLTDVLRGVGDLGRVDVVQPVLWAVMVSLAAVWAGYGVRPAAVVGHSQGEIAAAVVAGALSLEDGAKVVALRSKALRRLAGGGAMASLGVGQDRAGQLLSGLGDRAAGVGVAAVNGPSSTVISGPPEQVAAVVAACQEAGERARLIEVDYASHGPQMDEIRSELMRVLEGIRPLDTSGSDTAFYSTVTGGRAVTTDLDTGYWVTNLRERVRFTDAVEALLADGHRVFIEASTHPVLTLGLQETFDKADIAAVTVPTLRRDHGGQDQLLHSLAQAFTAGVDVDWSAAFPADPTPRTVDLPTYAFQRQRYWATAAGGVGDVGAAGLQRVEHPLLRAAVGLADGGLVLTGRVSATGGDGWLGDHVVAGASLVPGAALVEWALRAADEAGCGGVEELALQVPLVLTESGGLRVQIVVGEAAEDGRRDVRVYSRPDRDAGPGADPDWVSHAEGVLSPSTAPSAPSAAEGLAGVWPPEGAKPMDVEGFYERAVAAGYAYGPSFQGVRAVWRDGADLLAEVALPEAAGDADGFGIHPALLDAALHPMLLAADTESAGDEGMRLPFAWNGVSLWATEATTVRVRLSPRHPSPDQDGAVGERGLRVVVTDAMGAPVLTVDSLTMRPADPGQLRSGNGRGADGLFTLDWIPMPGLLDVDASDAIGWVVLGEDSLHLAEEPGLGGGGVVCHPDLEALVAALDDGAPLPAFAVTYLPADGDPAEAGAVARAADGLAAVGEALELVRGWLAEPRLADARLMVVTRGAVSIDGPHGEDSGDGALNVAAAGLWGLLRSAQAEHPDRFVLLDLHQATDSAAGEVADAVVRAVRADEPQVALRTGRPMVPRLMRARDTGGADEAESEGLTPAGLDPDGTVLITGGTGLLGGLVAEHLVRTWHVKHLVLVSRRGPDAPGAPELAERLSDLGAGVRIAAVDVTDAEAVADVVAGIDSAHPLTGVIHAAGLLDDAMVTSQTREQVARVWAAKATAAAYLHTATADLPLRMFVMFSSAAGVVGNAGQAGYAAANAFVDALVAHRRALGLPGLSLAWGLWAQASEMTGHMGRADLTRLRGMKPLSSERGLALLDAACRFAHPLMVAVDLDPAGAAGVGLPVVLRGLVGGRVRRRAAEGNLLGSGLVGRLVGLDAAARLGVVVDVVRGGVAVVLGFGSLSEVRVDVAFKELGFDSLTAVELRNRLSVVTGLRLPATLVFDYPTPRALAEYLCTRLTGETAASRAPLAVRADADDPVAIVGMTCRFPGGANSPEALWDLVASGKDVMGAFPTGRGWDLDGLFHPDPDHPGTSYANEGAFLYDADAFDAAFFGINPREALATDPQQRLLLEASWEVLERAGIDPVSLKGSSTGVYAGVMYHDYAAGLSGGDARLEGYAMLASSGSVVSGRVAYTLGFEGPAVTVDTACSSSLVAMHLAAQALRQGECTLALAGGVTVMATPDVFTGFSRQRGLAPDGRCKPFAAAADGTGWGEGVGVLLLERLSDAQRNGHDVLAVIRGSAVNQDGASNGLTAPNGPSQQRVIRQALASAGLSAADVDAVEAHGTGTTLGDPIEAQALLATYGQERPAEQPLLLGSIKSNIGHTQAAAGVAGVIKMVQAMRHGLLPASLHIDEPSPHVDWASGAVRLLTEAVEWPEGGRPRRAGVSSFGASGTNAHVVLEQAPSLPAEDTPTVSSDVGTVSWVLSGRSAEALRGQAAALAERVGDASEVSPVDVGWSLVSTRSVFEHRAVALGDDPAELLAAVEAVAEGMSHPGVVRSGMAALTGVPGPVLVFPGQGSQWAGMGAELLEVSPVFAARVAECARALSPYVDWSLTDVLRGAEGAADLGRVDVVQPVLWAVMVSLAAVWAGHGVRPAAVVGHSQGEIAAAVVAGALSLEDGAKVVALRSKALRRLAGGGAMASLGVGQERASQLLSDLGDQAVGVGVAAVNGPSSTVVSGPPEQVAAVVAACQEVGERARPIEVDYASHGPQVEEIRDELTRVLEGIRPLDTSGSGTAFYSTVTGGRAVTTDLDTGYWVTNLRERVRFTDAVEALLADGHRVFIEASTHPVLTLGLQETFDEADIPAVTVPTLRRDHGGQAQLLHSLAQAFTAGVDVDWTTLYPSSPTPRVVALPTYAFQRERYWLDGQAGRVGDPADLGLVSAGHPLLGAAVELADGRGHVLTGRISARTHAWLGEHVVADAVLVPGAALAEWMLRAADEVGCGGVEELALQVPLVLPESGGLRVQVVVGEAAEDGRRDVRVYSRPAGEGAPATGWVCHAEGVLSPPSDRSDDASGLGGAWPPAGAASLGVEGFYDRVAASGYAYGPSFQGLRAVWRDGADVYAEVVLPEAAGEQAGFGIHPALLDAALHPALLIDQLDTDGTETIGAEPTDGRVWLPFAWNGVTLWAAGATTVRVRLSPHQENADGERALRLTVADAVGAPVLTVDSVAMRPASVDQLRAAVAPGSHATDSLFTVEWTPLPLAAGTGEAAAEPGGVAAGAGKAAPGDDGWAVLGVGGHPDPAALVAALGDDEPVPPVVLADMTEPTRPIGEGAEEASAEALSATERALALVRGWLAEPRLAEARLVLVTRGAVTVDGPESTTRVDLAAAAVWGLVRSAQSENPGRFVLLDIDVDSEIDSDDDFDADTDTDANLRPNAPLRTAAASAMETDEPQLALRAGRALVPRLVHAGTGGAGLVGPVAQPDAWRLDTAGTATLENVVPVPCPEVLEPLGAGQVRVAVRAAGVNFRDVLVGLGMVPGQTGLGGEGAGVVVDIGPEVTHVSMGDRVMGILDQSFGPLAVTDARLLAPIPDGWSFRRAAAVPVACLTAWYGLTDLAGLRPGESVLIHAATGGVGTAAVRIARHLGAEVYATASPGKHGVLEAMGVDAAHRASSRDLVFEGAIREATGGRGVDVVLNSLAGPFVDASLRLLREGGRLLEMGKTDIRDPEVIAAEHPGVIYRVYDLIADAGPDRIGEMLCELGELFASGALEPPSVRAWPLSRAREALRYLSQAKHTGKLVLDVPAPVDPDGTVLITGGTGTLGGHVADHLVRAWHIRHLLLVSRGGMDAPGAEELVARLGELGAEARIAAVDVTDAAAVYDLVAGVDPAHPLTGVVHAAGALDDAMVTSQTPERLARVWGPKAMAAAHLHAATAHLRLGMFVMFSSAAGVMGSPGQANYAAANAYCDALAIHRQAMGLPAVSVAWGLWADASGMTGHLDEADLARMSRSGIAAMSGERALGLMDAACWHGDPRPAAVQLDLRALSAQPADTLPALLRTLLDSGTTTRRTAATGAPASGLVAQLTAVPAEEQHRILLTLVRTQAAAVLGHTDAGAVSADTPFKDLGFDSLTGVELRNRLAAATGLRLPATVVFRHPTPSAIATELREKLCPARPDTPAPGFGELEELETAVARLAPHDEARGRLAKRLEALLWRLGDDAPTEATGEDHATADGGGLDSASDDELFEFIDRELPS
ncbi:SDR family NAD(P)-dependent oxidoreductase [Streptomyces malaysiensis subsp. malaysiensis]|uniref:SDR family NAD(P)-dependent oxidoreductase n=2 Tax=Streptomyces malaysiensis TaxID=92644 RepID=A0ABX6WFQ9_STRMQ|nr:MULTISPECIES: type I polyketide synthase [Streptomyces]QPI60284.1 SDR family NAD(P)-dependent oxidoreductase [Streptomyces solisilvae]UHH21984.1 SDR family NAD(P)-dependent oxidoreductase [Streptomyces sp. HNM0561]